MIEQILPPYAITHQEFIEENIHIDPRAIYFLCSFRLFALKAKVFPRLSNNALL